MNPSGLRLEEKKSADEVRSVQSYKSTHSSRSSVLERAREYNRRIEEQEQVRRRSKSLERGSVGGSTASSSVLSSSSAYHRRSKSAGRAQQLQQQQQPTNNSSLHDRAMFSVRRDTAREQRPASATPLNQPRNNHHLGNNGNTAAASAAAQRRAVSASPAPQRRRHASPPTTATATTRTTSSSSTNQHQHPLRSSSAAAAQRSRGDVALNNNNNSSSNPRINDNAPFIKSRSTLQQQHTNNNNHYNHDTTADENANAAAAAAVVTPELLVDALSGHEDGLLAIAEKLMEHYDAGYDVMGEAIIDAFADVQKLFQHVVEAAHMEGAAFEASRREGELEDLRRQVGESVSLQQQQQQQQHPTAAMNTTSPSNNRTSPSGGGSSGPTRHDEFIDQDVKDILTEAIRKGTTFRDNNRHVECYELFEQACQAASSLLPVDSDHRGRLQLSTARAESMSPDRACAILRYAMDDVLRSGMRATRTPLPDPSQRADVVLTRPSTAGRTSKLQAGVVQSADEALASLMEEMKEILSAPVYNDTPLQSVAKRFWAALQESHKAQQKNQERLEQNLAKLKGEFLLARAVSVNILCCCCCVCVLLLFVNAIVTDRISCLSFALTFFENRNGKKS